MDLPDSQYFIAIDDDLGPDGARQLLEDLEVGGELRGKLEAEPENAQALFAERGIYFGDAVLPDQIELPAEGEIRKAIDLLEEQGDELEFTLWPFGGYHPGRRPFPGILLLIKKVLGGGG
jgi:hypothetical protein